MIKNIQFTLRGKKRKRAVFSNLKIRPLSSVARLLLPRHKKFRTTCVKMFNVKATRAAGGFICGTIFHHHVILQKNKKNCVDFNANVGRHLVLAEAEHSLLQQPSSTTKSTNLQQLVLLSGT
jgi:hypothetical protein